VLLSPVAGKLGWPDELAEWVLRDRLPVARLQLEDLHGKLRRSRARQRLHPRGR
jgi:hypothetical protein